MVEALSLGVILWGGSRRMVSKLGFASEANNIAREGIFSKVKKGIAETTSEEMTTLFKQDGEEATNTDHKQQVQCIFLDTLLQFSPSG